MGQSQLLQAMGAKVRKQRRRLGFTLDELAQKSGISKPYLSLIETGRVVNPASDEKLRRLEEVLGFAPGELVSQAHLCRTPRDIRAVLVSLMKGEGEGSGFRVQGSGKNGAGSSPNVERRTLSSTGINLDEAYLNGVLHELVERSAGNVEHVPTTQAVPVINKVSAGYPRDFTDLSYPPRVADEYVGCPQVNDKDAFAARVHGDSMRPRYREGDIVIFSPAAELRNGDDCFVRLECGQTTFKRVFFETDDAGREVVRLQPRNEKYRAQVLPREQVTGVYRAVYRYERLEAGE